MRALIAVCLLATGHAAASPPTREHLAPPGWEDSYHDIHYTPVVRIGNRLIISGIPAAVGDTEEAKLRWAFEQMKAHLAVAGATMADVVELTSFHVARDHEEFRTRMEPVLRVHAEYFKDHYPAWTAVGTTALFSKNAPMEVRAVAEIGSGKAPKADIPQPKKGP